MYITSCFSIAAFNILPLSLIFAILITTFLGMNLFGIVCASWTWMVFFSQLGKCSAIYYVFKYVLCPLLLLFSFWDPHNENVSMNDVVSEVF